MQGKDILFPLVAAPWSVCTLRFTVATQLNAIRWLPSAADTWAPLGRSMSVPIATSWTQPSRNMSILHPPQRLCCLHTFLISSERRNPRLNVIPSSADFQHLTNADSMHIRGSDVAEDQGVVILPGLIAGQRRIRAAYRIELVLPSIDNPGRQTEDESLKGNDISRVDQGIVIYIASG